MNKNRNRIKKSTNYFEPAETDRTNKNPRTIIYKRNSISNNIPIRTNLPLPCHLFRKKNIHTRHSHNSNKDQNETNTLRRIDRSTLGKLNGGIISRTLIPNNLEKNHKCIHISKHKFKHNSKHNSHRNQFFATDSLHRSKLQPVFNIPDDKHKFNQRYLSNFTFMRAGSAISDSTCTSSSNCNSSSSSSSSKTHNWDDPASIWSGNLKVNTNFELQNRKYRVIDTTIGQFEVVPKKDGSVEYSRTIRVGLQKINDGRY